MEDLTADQKLQAYEQYNKLNSQAEVLNANFFSDKCRISKYLKAMLLQKRLEVEDITKFFNFANDHIEVKHVAHKLERFLDFKFNQAQLVEFLERFAHPQSQFLSFKSKLNMLEQFMHPKKTLPPVSQDHLGTDELKHRNC